MPSDKQIRAFLELYDDTPAEIADEPGLGATRSERQMAYAVLSLLKDSGVKLKEPKDDPADTEEHDALEADEAPTKAAAGKK